tara:strand:+ start:128 stop:646 length:519 start_codon:yes stop_codon:yes gene_type:complete
MKTEHVKCKDGFGVDIIQPIEYAVHITNHTRPHSTKETFIPRVFRDKNKSFWLNRLLQFISNASDDVNTKRRVTFRMGPTTYKMTNRKDLMIGFYKRLSSRRNIVFPDVPSVSAITTRSGPLRKTEKSKTCYVCRKLKPNRMFYQRKNGTYFSGCIPCQKSIRQRYKDKRGI